MAADPAYLLPHVLHMVVEEVNRQLLCFIIKKQESAAAGRGVSFGCDEALD